MLLLIYFIYYQSWATEYCPQKKWTDDIQKLNASLHEGLEDSRNYFTNACRPDKLQSDSLESLMIKNSFAYKPPTSSLKTSVPFADLQGLKTQDFLKKLLSKVKQKHQLNSNFSFLMRQCTYQGKFQISDSCKSMNHWLNNDLPEIVKLTRFNLALAHPTDKSSMFSSGQETRLNYKLEPLKSFKQNNWKELNPSEYTVANQAFDQINNEINLHYKHDHSNDKDKKKRSDLLGIRHMHYMIYLSLMSINPILQYIQSETPTAFEINKAGQKIGLNLEKEKKYIDKVEKSIDEVQQNGRAGVQTLRSEVLSLLSYQADLEEVLTENPEFCGIALSLKQIESHRGTVSAISGLPILAASFFVPPLAGLAIGGTTSAYFIYKTKSNFTQLKTNEMSRVQNPGMSDFKKQLYQDYSNMTTDEVRISMQNDVTNIYRQRMQSVRQADVDQKVTLISTPLFFALPGVTRLIKTQSSKISQLIKNK